MTIFCRMRWAQLAAGLVALALLSAQAPAPEPMPNLAVPATAAIAPQTPAGYETITFKSKAADGATVTGYLKRPASAAPTQPTPAIVALHGCNGLFTSKGALTPLNRDWVQRFNGLGYAVLLVDSFNPRGFRDVCRLTASERTVRPFDRARDAAAAVAWLATDAAIDRQRIALIGWSHGGSTVLWAADKRLAFGNADIKAAIAFYPGCRVPAESANWAPRVALTILIGAADDWTPPESCRALAARHASVRYIEYPGAVHAFDAPNSPPRVLTGLGLPKSGTAKIGTDPNARAAAIAVVQGILAEAFK